MTTKQYRRIKVLKVEKTNVGGALPMVKEAVTSAKFFEKKRGTNPEKF